MASQLSPRQREILELVASGRTSKEIAAALGISQSTVNWHLANTFQRLGASSRAEAVALAMQSRPAEPIPPPRPSGWLAGHVGLRLVVIGITIALVGAVVGGAAVAAFRIGAPQPTPHGAVQTPTATIVEPTHNSAIPTSASDRTADQTAAPTPAPGGAGAVTPAPIQVPTVAPLSAPSLPTASAPSLPAPITTLLPALPSPVPTPGLPTLP